MMKDLIANSVKPEPLVGSLFGPNRDALTCCRLTC